MIYNSRSDNSIVKHTIKKGLRNVDNRTTKQRQHQEKKAILDLHDDNYDVKISTTVRSEHDARTARVSLILFNAK